MSLAIMLFHGLIVAGSIDDSMAGTRTIVKICSTCRMVLPLVTRFAYGCVPALLGCKGFIATEFKT
jgi:hypothetical protein